jgi:hypothetical protein
VSEADNAMTRSQWWSLTLRQIPYEDDITNVQMRHREGFEELGYELPTPGTTAEPECSMTLAVSYFKALGHSTRLRCAHLMLEQGTLSVGLLSRLSTNPSQRSHATSGTLEAPGSLPRAAGNNGYFTP